MLIIHPLVMEDPMTGEVRVVEVDDAEFFGVYEQDREGNLIWVSDFATLTSAKSYVSRRNRFH
jgi:hypothetical protein